jgi:hypothetical protein
MLAFGAAAYIVFRKFGQDHIVPTGHRKNDLFVVAAFRKSTPHSEPVGNGPLALGGALQRAKRIE